MVFSSNIMSSQLYITLFLFFVAAAFRNVPKLWKKNNKEIKKSQSLWWCIYFGCYKEKESQHSTLYSGNNQLNNQPENQKLQGNTVSGSEAGCAGAFTTASTPLPNTNRCSLSDIVSIYHHQRPGGCVTPVRWKPYLFVSLCMYFLAVTPLCCSAWRNKGLPVGCLSTSHLLASRHINATIIYSRYEMCLRRRERWKYA